MGDDSIDMEDDLMMTVSIWELTVSIWEMTVSIWDILSLCLEHGGQLDDQRAEAPVQALGPARYCTPRHAMPFNSRHEGLNTEDDVAGNICQALPGARCRGAGGRSTPPRTRAWQILLRIRMPKQDVNSHK